MPKMTSSDWRLIRNFSLSENWGDPYQMDRDLIYLLEVLRGLFRFPFSIHCGYQKRPEKPTSQHNFGKACDFHIDGMTFIDAVDLMLIFIGPKPSGIGVSEIIGLGIYPHWKNPGFHIDTRGERARWGAVMDGGRQVYVSFSEAYRRIVG